MKWVGAFLTIWLCAFGFAFAKDAPRVPVVGVMRINSAADNEPFATLFREALAARGFVDGRNVRLDVRFADGDAQRFPEMAEALVKENVSVILPFGGLALRAVQRATHTMPIVVVGSDLVAAGLVAGLAKPGGNITGFGLLMPELEAKRLEILKEILPAARRFGVLLDFGTKSPPELQAIEEGARALGVTVQVIGVSKSGDIAPAFDAFRSSQVEAAIVAGTILFNFRGEVGALALTHKLPAICEWSEMAAAGCLGSYGPSLHELYDTLADLTGEILKGASPADLPVRQPTKFELVINRKTAREIGVGIPPSVLARADEVIE